MGVLTPRGCQRLLEKCGWPFIGSTRTDQPLRFSYTVMLVLLTVFFELSLFLFDVLKCSVLRQWFDLSFYLHIGRFVALTGNVKLGKMLEVEVSKGTSVSNNE